MYVVFNVDTTHEKKQFKHYGHAKRHAVTLTETAASRRQMSVYDVVHVDFYNLYIVHWVHVRSIVGAHLVWEKSNLPYYCSVSSETYWSS